MTNLRKRMLETRNPIVLGFQNPAQIETHYGKEASAMLSQPSSKMYFRVTDPPSAKWISEAIGEVEIERLKESRYDGTRVVRPIVREKPPK